MTVIGTIKCDRCGATEEVPPSGGYPQDWGAITFRAALPPEGFRMSHFRDKRRWHHVCPRCGTALGEFLRELEDHPDSTEVNDSDTTTDNRAGPSDD